MLKYLCFAILLLTFGQFTKGQVVQLGRCPSVNVMTSFDLESYTGLWYEYAKYPALFELGQKCNYAKYGVLANDKVSVYNHGIHAHNGQPNSVTGYAKVLGPARLAVVFFEGQSETKPNYEVLATDYESYALVYSCENMLFSHSQYLWILTRDPSPKAETIEAVKKVINDNGLSQAFLIKTDQEDCSDV